MSTSRLARLTAIIHRYVLNPFSVIRRHRWLVVGGVALILAALTLMIGFNSPARQLRNAQNLWASEGARRYRITVRFERPYSDCEQEFDVENEVAGFKHRDSCTVGTGVIGKPREETMPTVSNLFQRVADGLAAPLCGQNGCVCDGPVEMTAQYDPERGYPTTIEYRLRPDWRWSDPAFWLAQLNGTLAQCPMTAYVGQTIRVVGFEALPAAEAEAPVKEPLVAGDKKPESESGIEELAKPEATAEGD